MNNCCVSVKATVNALKISVLGVTVYKRKYKDGGFKRYVLGLPARTVRKSRKIPIELSSAAFVPFELNNETLLNELRALGPFTYIPNLGNLGDMLIAAATLQFFDRNNLPYTLYSEAENKSCDGAVVYGGGGIWISEYESAITHILRYFEKAKKVVILPSSFRDCDNLLNVVDERFTLFCREEASYDYLNGKHLRAKVILDHDMAFRMTSEIFSKREIIIAEADRYALKLFKRDYPQGRDIGYFLRRDCERVNDYDTDLDVSGYFYGSENASRSFIDFCALVMLSATEGMSTVITDRLHVSVAATLTGREVYILDNSYKKLSGVYNRTMKGRDGVHLIDSLPVSSPGRNKCVPGNNLQRLFDAVGI